MMRAIFSFRNLDSTADINARFSKLFNMGFFDGADIAPVTGQLKVDIAPFKAISEDGMVIVESGSTRLTLIAGSINYIVLRAVYLENDPPILSWEVLEQSAYLADAQKNHLLVRAVVSVPGVATSITQSMIDESNSHFVDKLGRGSFRGTLTSVSLLPAANNRAGDAYLITNGGNDTPSMYCFNGSVWQNITQAAAVNTVLNLHRQNLFADELHLTQDQSEALIGSSGTVPSFLNPYVDSADPRIPTQLENDALAGTPNSAIDSRIVDPDTSNRYVTESKHVGVGEEKVYASGLSGDQTLAAIDAITDGPIWIGSGSSSEVVRYFVLFNQDPTVDLEYVNTLGQVPRIIGVYLDSAMTVLIDPALHTVPPGGSQPSGFYRAGTMYIKTDLPIDSGFRLSYIKQYTVGTMPPDAFARRKPSDAQIDSRIGLTTKVQRFLISSEQQLINLNVNIFSMVSNNQVLDVRVRENTSELIGDDGYFTPIVIQAGVNDRFDFKDSNNIDKSAILTPATYSTVSSLDLLALDLETKMTSVTTDTISVAYSNYRFTITNGTAQFGLLSGTGANFEKSAAVALGFSPVDAIGSLSYTSNNQIDRGYIQWTKLSDSSIYLFEAAQPNGVITVEKFLTI